MKHFKGTGLKEGEIAVSQNDFGWLVESYIRQALRPRFGYDLEQIVASLRKWWPKLEGYYQRHIMCDIEVAILLDEDGLPDRELERKDLWVQFVKDFRPPKAAFTVDYHCHKCKQRDVKLWRGVHGCADSEGNELLCATCLAPDVKVDDEGRWQEPPYETKDAYGNEIPGPRTDQVKGWLPAIPVDDTYWGYSSVPSQDVEWWRALPTYPAKKF